MKRWHKSLQMLTIVAVVLVALTVGAVPAFAGTQGNMLYGLREVTNPDGSITYTAYFLPDFSSNNVDWVQGIIFSFWLPVGTQISPNLGLSGPTGSSYPAEQSYNGMQWYTEVWNEPFVNAYLASSGLLPIEGDPFADRDLYVFVLENTLVDKTVVAGQPYDLFSFTLPNGCASGQVQILDNSEAITTQLARTVGVDIRNNAELSVDNTPGAGNDYYNGNDPNGNSWNCALAAQLAGFEASSQGDGVQVVWETVSEATTASFNLYRSTSIDGEWTLLTNMPATGGGMGAVYTYTDTNVELGSTYFYSLEDVDANGNTHRYDPVSVVHQAPTAVTLSTLAANAGNSNSMLPILLIVLLSGVLVLWRRQTAR